jgi:hypothetical protein
MMLATVDICDPEVTVAVSPRQTMHLVIPSFSRMHTAHTSLEAAAQACVSSATAQWTICRPARAFMGM